MSRPSLRFLLPLFCAALAGCVGAPEDTVQELGAGLANAVSLRPAADVASSRMVGVADSSRLYADVDDGITAAASDNDTSYVRAYAGAGQGTHTVSYSGAPGGTVTAASVSYTANRGTTSSATAQAFLYDGTREIGAGKVNALGVWTSYRDTFPGLSVTSGNTLRTKMVLTNQSGSGAARYSEVWLDVSVGTSVVDAGQPVDAGRPDPVDGGHPVGPVVDASTLNQKLIMGYQGWFFCPGDGSAINRWVHWFGSAGNPTVDLWPDMSELPAAERCATPENFPNGQVAPVFSAFRAPTVARHFRWMQENNLDGVMLQRFSSELKDPAFAAARDQVTRNVRAGAETYGRTFSIMYDISGQDPATLVATLENDWKHLVDDLGVTASSRYLRHNGKPVLALWGLGFSDRGGTPAQGQALLDFFKNNSNHRYQVTLVGGVPRSWRSSAAWLPVFHGFDVISPWTVGSYSDDAGVDAYQSTLTADLADCTAHGQDYLPVIFPGFSWHNLNGGPGNQIPRRGGKLYWRQVLDASRAGVSMLYGAMFDEVDEGTAMFKVAPTSAEQPTQFPYVPLNVDGQSLPSDWYLRLADQAGRVLRGELVPTATLPIAP